MSEWPLTHVQSPSSPVNRETAENENYRGWREQCMDTKKEDEWDEMWDYWVSAVFSTVCVIEQLLEYNH